jgi:F-type H+-transporting ATPase subunit epsilon
MLYARRDADQFMSAFTLNLFASDQAQRIAGVTTFVGEDASGSFGIQAYHARFMTTLVFGLARFKQAEDVWHYLAVPSAVLYFNDNTLTISTQHFLLDDNLERISDLLQQQWANQEHEVRATRESLKRMEQAMLKRLMSLKHKTAWQS